MSEMVENSTPEVDDVLDGEALELEDVNLEEEGLEEDVEEDDVELEGDDDEDDDDGEEDEDDDDSTEEDVDDEKVDDGRIFNEEQQKEVNRVIKARLERHDAKLTKDLSKAAGVEISSDEVAPAARLWGLLKTNPELSSLVDTIIADSLREGKAKAPDAADTSVDAVTQRLELKEAILDLKASDKTFSKNADKIIEWAENEGYEVKNGKALRLAYLAWKGSQGKVDEAVRKSIEKRKQDSKKARNKKATVQGAKPGKTGVSKANYSKMSDASLLASEGLELFTDD